MAEYYSSTVDECYETGRHGHGHGHGGMRVQSHADDYYSDGEDRGRRTNSMHSQEYLMRQGSGGGGYGGGGEQEYYKREEREHRQRERMGEIGALASGAFALYEGHQAKKDPANAQRHRIEQGVAAVGALGAGGYAYHEHREQKDASYGAKEQYGRMPQPQHASRWIN
ncbi:hypothetical protein E2562_028024 [Oryza meyeriana var. granulata]|uniref:Uncharacterized protein n=1 Tax=Oryza meyeriana var. granulata TaxID=110450 RepID=A0A6G1C098_9ORYZ|nr:hypothetical protein E2562_028024 [Oryza meyeriana var. granulata]